METQQVVEICDEIEELTGYDRYTSWVYVATLLASKLSLTGEAEVMKHLEYVRTQKAIKNAKEKN